MTIFLLLGLGLWAGAVPPHPALLLAAVAAGLLEFHLKGWLLFCAIMRLAIVRDERRLSWMQTILGTGWLGIALLWDVLMNVFATLWLLQLPFKRVLAPPRPGEKLPGFLQGRQWLLSQRLEANVFRGQARWEWQRRWSERFRQKLLDNIDPRGVHRS